MKIRKASIKDIDKLYYLIGKTKEVHITENIYSKSFIKKLIKNRTTYAIIVEEDKKIIGLLTAAIWKYLGASYVDMVIVDREFRNKGIAKELYKNYLLYLKKNKISYVWWLVDKNNKKIQKILEKLKLKKRKLCYYYDMKLK
jgi:ribosomal protein S18 acetylase RimI-like enzyme